MREKAKNQKQKIRRKSVQNIDYTLLLMIICILGFGLVMLYSTSAYNATLKFGSSIYYLKRQIRAAAIGFVLLYICIKLGYRFFEKVTFLAYVLATFLCIIVIFVGDESHGSSRWLSIGGFSFQPSELGKVAVILFLATVISKRPNILYTGLGHIKLFACLLPILLPVAYTNLSTAVIIAGIAFLMIFIASPKKRIFAALIAAVFAVGAIFLLFSSGGYRLERIQTWLHPEEHYDSAYQTLQGLYAIGSGGLFGKGLGESMQKMGFVPEAQNDMIFSIICEELGLFGAICVILMYLLLLWRLLLIAGSAKDMFGSYLVIGIMCHIGLQVFLNIAVVTNLFPNTGVTLPFISYGGSALMILIAEMGIALSVSKSAKVDET